MFRFMSVVLLMFFPVAANSEPVQAASDGFQLRLESPADLPFTELYNKIGNLADWWSDSHTYSGSADNLSLSAMAPGGIWLEAWQGGEVEHGRVIANMVSDHSAMIRFDAPLGPLQGMGVKGVLTITVTPETDAETTATSLVVFEYVVVGASFQNLDKLAPIVEGVLNTQMTRLAQS